MAVIAMCNNAACKRRIDCWRYLRPPDEDQEYFQFGGENCKFFMPIYEDDTHRKWQDVDRINGRDK